MRRAILLALLLLAALPAAASAHPLGNFSVNHIAQVSVSKDRVDVRYVLDQAEIPTFQERGVPDAEVLARKQAEVRKRLVLTVDGAPRRIEGRGSGHDQPPARRRRPADHARGAPADRRGHGAGAGGGA